MGFLPDTRNSAQRAEFHLSLTIIYRMTGSTLKEETSQDSTCDIHLPCFFGTKQFEHFITVNDRFP